MNQFMNVRFWHDPSDIKRSSRAIIDHAGRIESISKEDLLNSLETEIAAKGFIVNDDITRQDVGDFIYYHFFYFDGITSRNMQFQIPKADIESNRRMDHIRTILENRTLRKSTAKYHNLKVFGEKALATIAAGIVLVTITIGGTILFLDTWEKESQLRDEYIQTQIPQEMKDEWARRELEEQYPEIIFEDTGRGLH